MLTQPVLQGLATTLLGALGLLAGLIGAGPALLRRRPVRWPLLVVAVIVLVAGLGVTIWGLALGAGDRTPSERPIAPGVVYRRLAIDEPRRQVAHLAVVDLDHRCVGLATTRPAADGLVPAETTTDYVTRTGASLAVNVAFFFPIDEYPHWDSYPTPGDPITAIGPVVVDGRSFGSTDGGWDLGLGLHRGRGWAGPVLDDPDFSVPARLQLVADGQVVAPDSEPYPRTVAGIDLDTNRLVVLVADGKQPGYAEGMTYREVAALLVEFGVDEAVEFDGGGSATMAASVDGTVELLSRPSHQRIPGRQRPVATHLGITERPGCR